MARNGVFKLNDMIVRGVENYANRSKITLTDADTTVTIERRTSLPPRLRRLSPGDTLDLGIAYDEGGG